MTVTRDVTSTYRMLSDGLQAKVQIDNVELQDLLHDASERQGSFPRVVMHITLVVKSGMKKYFMDEIDTYYTALVLDPRVKGDLIRQDLSDDDDAVALSSRQ
ncbi:uncharacterized protein V1513DRAFT_428057 [Lipomyces chichibuensis]|uniref:uncharacterized protein n=1 Tax=Lipomyces chichibuensis TaxID=1546026 RepID=UPI003343956B